MSMPLPPPYCPANIHVIYPQGGSGTYIPVNVQPSYYQPPATYTTTYYPSTTYCTPSVVTTTTYRNRYNGHTVCHLRSDDCVNPFARLFKAFMITFLVLLILSPFMI